MIINLSQEQYTKGYYAYINPEMTNNKCNQLAHIGYTAICDLVPKINIPASNGVTILVTEESKFIFIKHGITLKFCNKVSYIGSSEIENFLIEIADNTDRESTETMPDISDLLL